MTDPLPPPKRNNPLARTRRPLLPPAARSRTAHLLTLAAAEGRFALQRCAECGRFAYPPRDACPHCLSHRLPLEDADPAGRLVSATTIHVSPDPYFRERLPWRTGIVLLDCGPTAIAHLHGDCREGDRVTLRLMLDKAGQAVVFALPAKETPAMEDDPAWREMTADPKFRRVLVTDGRHPAGQAMAAALARAGAARIFVGIAEPWKPFAGSDGLDAVDGVEIVPLDPTDERSVLDLAARIGARVDILVNTAGHVPTPAGLFEPAAAARLQQALDATLIGTMRLARAFGPAMLARAADGTRSAAAWVNLLPAYALAGRPDQGAVSVAAAAGLSLSHWLRAELAAGGIRLLNAFAGPLDTEAYQAMPPPKVTPDQLARAVIDGLRRGLEDIDVGDVARDIRARLRANPKALERESGQ